MQTDEILRSQFVEDSSTIVTGITEPISADSENFVDVYVVFTATSVSAVSLSYDDSYTGYGQYEVVILSNENNPENLYGIHLQLDKENEEQRISNFTATVKTNNAQITKTVSFYTKQTVCVEQYTVTVCSTVNCTISIDGVQDGSRTFNTGDSVTGITTSVINPSSYILDGYWVQQDNGTEYRVELNETIIIQSNNITISPICSYTASSLQYNIVGFNGGTYNIQDKLGFINIDTQEITPITHEITRESNNLGYEWGNIFGTIDENGYMTVTYFGIPKRVEYNGSGNMYSSLARGTEATFVLGLSRSETRYEPYGFQVTEHINDKEKRVTILMPFGYADISTDSNGARRTDVAIYAKKTILYHTDIRCLVKTKTTGFVKFNMNGHGTQIANQVIPYGNTVAEPTTPTAGGYIFRGWYTDIACTDGNEYDFTQPVLSNIILYAKWVQLQLYVIEYTTNNGNIIQPSGDFNATLVENVIISSSDNITYCELHFDSIPTKIPNSAFNDKRELTSINIPSSIDEIGASAFRNCRALTSIVIPDNVTNINDDAFYECRGLTSVIIGAGITSINTSTFDHCSSLANITIPNNVITIGNKAFNACGLTSIVIPNSVTTIGTSAFYRCVNLTSITIGSGVVNIGGSLLTDCPLTEIIVSPGNTIYDSRNNCNAIIETASNTLKYGCMNTVIPSNITSIANEAFSKCQGLENIVIPDSITSIGDSAFASTGLGRITIPDSVISIGSKAFQNCISLSGLTIGSGVASIGDSSFQYCYYLTNVTCRASTPPTINSTVFADTSTANGTLYVPSGTRAVYQSSTVWSNFRTITEISQ